MRRAHRTAASGFTLIEVLAALVIVALGMLAAIEAVSHAATNGAYLREKTLGHWIAMNVITERRLRPAPPDVGESSDDVDFAGERWRWTLKVTQTQVQSMRRMDVAVRLAAAPEGTSVANASGFYGAAIGQAGGGTVTWGGPGGGGPDPQGEDDGSGDGDGDGNDGDGNNGNGDSDEGGTGDGNGESDDNGDDDDEHDGNDDDPGDGNGDDEEFTR